MKKLVLVSAVVFLILMLAISGCPTDASPAPDNSPDLSDISQTYNGHIVLNAGTGGTGLLIMTAAGVSVGSKSLVPGIKDTRYDFKTLVQSGISAVLTREGYQSMTFTGIGKAANQINQVGFMMTREGEGGQVLGDNAPLNGVKFLGDNFYVYGYNGNVGYGTAGTETTWTEINGSSIFTQGIKDVVLLSGNKLYAIGVGANGGTAAISTNHTTFSSAGHPNFGTEPVNAIANYNDNIIAVGGGGMIARSTNGGSAWTTIGGSAFGTHSIVGVAAQNDFAFVAVARTGGLVGLSYDNGGSWSVGSISTFVTYPPRSIAYMGYVSSNLPSFVVTSDGGRSFVSSTGAVLVSVGWTNPTPVENKMKPYLNSAAYGGTFLVAAGEKGFFAYSAKNVGASSENLTTSWVSFPYNVFRQNDEDITGVAYGNGKFVLAGNKGKVAYIILP